MFPSSIHVWLSCDSPSGLGENEDVRVLNPVSIRKKQDPMQSSPPFMVVHKQSTTKVNQQIASISENTTHAVPCSHYPDHSESLSISHWPSLSALIVCPHPHV